MPKKSKESKSRRLEASNAELADHLQIAEILQLIGTKDHEWLLITQWHDFPFEGALHDTLQDLIIDLGDALTCHYGIMAIYQRGRLLSGAEVETLINQALSRLGPISRAKAQGLL